MAETSEHGYRQPNDEELILQTNPANAGEIVDLIIDADMQDLIDNYRDLRDSYNEKPSLALKNEMD